MPRPSRMFPLAQVDSVVVMDTVDATDELDDADMADEVDEESPFESNEP
jgi:hypothetical protein